MRSLPTGSEFEVIVVGGGPAGSATAALLAQQGRRVLLLERTPFPRHHVGESTLLSIHSPLNWLGVAEKVAAAGFRRKTGGSYIWGVDRIPWSFHFSEINDQAAASRPSYSYEVERDLFDAILLDHAEECGAKVLRDVTVQDYLIEDGYGVRGVRTGDDRAGATGTEITASLVVDASGQGCLSGRRFGWRGMHGRLRNSAAYGYWSGGPPEYTRLGGDLTPADHSNILICSTEFGWIWVIPLRGDRVSIGTVSAGRTEHWDGRRGQEIYYDRVRSCTELSPILQLLAPLSREPVRFVRDWSYRCSQFSAPGLLLVGDAACFVDPILSTGLHLALRGGISAACVANSVLGGGDERLARLWYDSTYSAAYEQYEQMALWWYHGDRNRERWFERSRRLIDRNDFGRDLPPRKAFIHLAAGLDAANYVEECVEEWAHPLRMEALFHKHASFTASLPRLRERFGVSPVMDPEPSAPERRDGADIPAAKGPRIRRDAVLSVAADPDGVRIRMYWNASSPHNGDLRVDLTGLEALLSRCDGSRTIEQIEGDLDLGEDDQGIVRGAVEELARAGLLEGVGAPSA